MITGPDRVPSCTVVVCAYTDLRWDLLSRGYEATIAQLGDRDQLIMVIDHNSELEERARTGFERAMVIPNSEARGLSGARNSGVARATGDVVIFLDDDACPEPGWLAAYRRAFEDPTVAVVAGAVHAAWVGPRPRWFPDEFGWVVGCDYRGLPDSGASVRNAIGANMAVRRSALTRVGAFAAEVGRVGTLPLGAEETDLCIRIRQQDPGARMVRDTSAAVRHVVPTERRKARYFLSRCFYEGRSKAVLARRVGRADGLSSERAYVTRVLPGGVLNGLTEAGRGDPAGIGRSLAIGAGLAATASGYLTAKAAPRPGWQPLVVSEYDIGGANLHLNPEPESRTRLLVTSAGSPLGCVDLPPAAPVPQPDEVIQRLSGPSDPDEQQPSGEDTGQTYRGSSVFCPPVTVVVPTRGRAGELLRCVRSVLALDYPRFEVLIVDNNDRPGSVADVLEPLRLDRRLRIVHQPILGVSPARNLGTYAAAYDLVAATDDDVVVSSQWLKELVAPFADPEVVCVTGLVVPDGFRSRAQEMFEEFGGFSKGFRPARYDLRDHRADHLLYPYSPGIYGSGNNVAYRRDRIAALGGYDVGLGPGTPARAGEDLDLFLKVLFDGGSIYYQPRAWVRHYHRDSVGALRRQLRDYGRGLSAVIVTWAMSDRHRAIEIARLVPAGLRHLFDPGSGKNTQRGADYPGSLRRAELRGLVEGALLTFVQELRRRGPRQIPLELHPHSDTEAGPDDRDLLTSERVPHHAR